jgi:hypothetical protein
VNFYQSTMPGERGLPVGVDEPLSLTQIAISALEKATIAHYGKPLDKFEGSIVDQNRLNFQREFAKQRVANVPVDEALLNAAKQISYGKHRIAAGYTEFDVKALGEPSSWPLFATKEKPPDATASPAAQTIADGLGRQRVPEYIEINVGKPK